MCGYVCVRARNMCICTQHAYIQIYISSRPRNVQAQKKNSYTYACKNDTCAPNLRDLASRDYHPPAIYICVCVCVHVCTHIYI